MKQVHVILILAAQLEKTVHGVLFKTGSNNTGFRHIFHVGDLKCSNSISIAEKSDAKITTFGFQIYLIIIMKKGIENLFEHVSIGDCFYLFSHLFSSANYTGYIFFRANL